MSFKDTIKSNVKHRNDLFFEGKFNKKQIDI